MIRPHASYKRLSKEDHDKLDAIHGRQRAKPAKAKKAVKQKQKQKQKRA